MQLSHVGSAYVPRLAGVFDDDRSWWEGRGTLVFADLSGFTRLSERLARRGRVGAEQLVGVLNHTFTELLAAAEARGADLLKFGGDALLMLVRGEAHADRAVDAAVSMRATLARLPAVDAPGGSVRLRMSVGVATGEVLVAAAGRGHRELVLVGPTATSLAELEKVASAGQIVVSPTTAQELTAHRTGRPVGAGVLVVGGRGGSELAASPGLPPGSTDPLRYVPPPLRGLTALPDVAEHRRVAIAFVKVTGVDRLLETRGIGPAIGRLTEVVDAVERIADVHGLTFLTSDLSSHGCKLILLAGAPVSRVDDAERLLVAAADVAATGGDGLEVRVGVNRGAVFAADVGSPTRRSYTTIGDAMNLAARLVERAEAGSVVSSSSPLASARSEFHATSLGEWTLKGKARPVPVWRVGGVTGHRRSDPGDVELVGRDEARSAIAATVEAGEGALDVQGPPGSGVSRVLAELLAALPGRPVVRAWGSAARPGRPWPLAAALLDRAAQGIDRTDPGRVTGWEAQPGVDHRSDPAQHRDAGPATGLGTENRIVLDAVRTGRPVDGDHGPLDERRVIAAVDAELARLLPRGAVLVIDDAQMITGGDRTLLRRLVASAGVRGWIVAVGRHDTDAPFDGARAVPLAPLSHREARRLAVELLGSSLVHVGELERILQRADGNPKVLVHLMRAVADGETDVLPDSVESVAVAELDALEPLTRLAVRQLAVVGPVVPYHLVEVVLGDGASRFDDLSVSDPVRQVLVPTAHGFRFRSELVCTAARDGLPFGQRRIVHGKILDHLCEHRSRRGAHADDVPEVDPGELAHHAFHAQRHADAWHWSRLAARAAMHAGAPTAAMDMADLALASARIAGEGSDLATAADEAIAEVAELLGDAADRAGAFDRATRAYRSARRRASDPVDVARLVGKEAGIEERCGRLGRAASGHRRALRLLEPFTDDRAVATRAQVLVDLAGVHLRRGAPAACEAACRRAIVDASAVGAGRPLAHAFSLLDAATTDLGRPTPAYRKVALPIFERLDDVAMVGNVHNNLGVNAHVEGRWDDAVVHYRAAATALRRAGHTAAAATAINNLGEIESDRGQLAAATSSFEEAAIEFRLAGFPLGLGVVESNQGRLAIRLGRLDVAAELLDRAHDRFDAIGAKAFIADVAVRRAELAIAAGRPVAALDLVSEARRRFGDLGQSEAAGSRVEARALEMLGRRAEARAAWQAAIDDARRFGLLHEVAIAELRLGEMSSRSDDGAGSDGRRDETAARTRAARDVLDRLGIVWR